MTEIEVKGLTLDVPGRRLFRDLSLTADAKECIAIMGPSGSGKTSLLNCLCGIVKPTWGTITIHGANIPAMDDVERTAFRLEHIGLVFQFGEFLPELSVIENVSLPARLLGANRRNAEDTAVAWLQRVGLEIAVRTYPDTLSGGELQRAGIARALAHNPSVILEDEPTGALDEANAVHVTELLFNIARDDNIAVIVAATHDPAGCQTGRQDPAPEGYGASAAGAGRDILTHAR